MVVAIPDEFAEYVASGIASGRFRSEDEAVREALLVLRERDRKLQYLKADLAEGAASLDAGDSVPLDAADIKRRGRERMSADSGT